jgi:hypothetical protein
MIMETLDYIDKIIKPGLWFTKSRQPVVDLSRFVYAIAVELGQPVTILSSQQRQIQNEVFSLIRKDFLENASDEHEYNWLEQELSEYNTHGQFWYPEEMNDYVPHGAFWSNYVQFDAVGWLSLANCSFNIILVDGLSALWWEDETDLSRFIPLVEQDAVEYKKTILVFVASSNISMTNEYIENHLF